MRPMHRVIRVEGAGRHSANRVRLWTPEWDPDRDPLEQWREALGLEESADERAVVDSGSCEGWHLPNAVPVLTRAHAHRDRDGRIHPQRSSTVPMDCSEALDESSARLSIWVRARSTHQLYGSWFSPVLPVGGLVNQVVLVLPPHWRLRCESTH